MSLLHYSHISRIAAKAGGPLSDPVGIYKDSSDSSAGSGFSFGDTADDRAGTRFAEKAVQSAESARKLERRVGARGDQKTANNDPMPAALHLPRNSSLDNLINGLST